MVELLADLVPIGLVEIGMPSNEYEPEVTDLMRRRQPSPAEVRDVFVRWFGEGTGDIGDDIAGRLAKGIRHLQWRYLL